MELKNIAIRSREASKQLALTDSKDRNTVLKKIAEALAANKEEIFAANIIDVKNARSANLSAALLDRLILNEERLKSMEEGLLQLVELDDPLNRTIKAWKTHHGLDIMKITVPIGVIAMIYEARPNVTVDAAGLCLKSGNTVILRGSKNAFNTNKILVKILREALHNTNIPVDSIQLVEDMRHEAIYELLNLYEYIDLAIPRGGEKLIKSIREHSKVPVIATGVGNCHLYIDENADIDKALAILLNGKIQRPGVCNALETLLVHNNIAEDFLSVALEKLSQYDVEIRGCQETKKYANNIITVTEEDYATEFHDLIIAVKVIGSYEEAISHINKYSSGHSEAIVTENYTLARKFLNDIDSACVYVNASTRFSDGFEFGFGAEIGISTQKMHERGPMGVEALTSTKYCILGNGQIR